MTADGWPRPGLRERKKAKTRAEIQRQALRLFREQGYEVTTVSQIAAAAEVSESTYFRYFPTKEDVVWLDDFDPAIFAAFHAQPAGTDPVRALRAAMRETLADLPAADRAALRERVELVLSVPPLRATLLDQLRGPLQLLTEAVAERTGGQADGVAARAWAGAVIGVGLAAMFVAADDPNADVIELIDAMLGRLEAGFPGSG